MYKEYLEKIKKITKKDKCFNIDDLNKFMEMVYNAKAFLSVEEAFNYYNLPCHETIESLSEFSIDSNNYVCYAIEDKKYVDGYVPCFVYVEYYPSRIIKEIAPSDTFKDYGYLKLFVPFGEKLFFNPNSKKEFEKALLDITGKTTALNRAEIRDFMKKYYYAELFENDLELNQKYNLVATQTPNNTDYFVICGEKNYLTSENSPLLIEINYSNNKVISVLFNDYKFKNSGHLVNVVDVEEAINLLL